MTLLPLLLNAVLPPHAISHAAFTVARKQPTGVFT
jgi:hypothetical protein